MIDIQKLYIFSVYDLMSLKISRDCGDGFAGVHHSPNPRPSCSVLARDGTLFPYSPRT